MSKPIQGKTVTDPREQKTEEKAPDLFKSRAELNAARKAFDKIDKQHKRAMKRLSEAQRRVDLAVKDMRKDAPAGSTWGSTIVGGIDASSLDDWPSLIWRRR